MPHFDVPTGSRVRIIWSPSFDLTVTGPGEHPNTFNTVDPQGWGIRNLKATDLVPHGTEIGPLNDLARRLVREVATEQGGVTGDCRDALSICVLAEVQGNDLYEVAFQCWAHC